MKRIHNFSAGPAALPLEVLQQARDEMLDWHGSGMSVMEMSHRGAEFMQIAEQAEADLRDLMGIPANYKVLFLQGGALTQFAMVPLNLLGERTDADYVITGYWSQGAYREAARFGNIRIAATAEVEAAGDSFHGVPPRSTWTIHPQAAYLHYCSNETIHGVEFPDIPADIPMPLVCDMSSNILSQPVDVSRFGLIYAGAQKNIGPAGVTVVIVRDDLLAEPQPNTPTMLDYRVHAKAGSMYNTPPTYAMYIAGLVFQWLKRQGGLAAMAQHNRAKADLLYAAIDATPFYRNPVAKTSRSRMNVPFFLQDPRWLEPFLREAESHGLMQLKGHRLVGGLRASLYNAVSLESVQALVDFMQDFAKRHA